MRRQLLLFRRHIWLWAVPLALVMANFAWTLAFGSGARLRAADLESRLARARDEHLETNSLFEKRERIWIAMVENRKRLEELLDHRLSTQRNRFTAIVSEVRDLARRSGLEPSSVTYPDESLEEYGLVRTSFVFAVEGSYADLRAFLHLLELSPSFLVVDQLSVNEDGRGTLRISLRLSTLFAEDRSAETPTESRSEAS